MHYNTRLHTTKLLTRAYTRAFAGAPRQTWLPALQTPTRPDARRCPQPPGCWPAWRAVPLALRSEPPSGRGGVQGARRPRRAPPPPHMPHTPHTPHTQHYRFGPACFEPPCPASLVPVRSSAAAVRSPQSDRHRLHPRGRAPFASLPQCALHRPLLLARSTSPRTQLRLAPHALAGAAAAPRCTLWQGDASETNLGFEFASTKSWEAASRTGKVLTPYNQFCFKISTQTKHANRSTGTLQTCSEAGFGPEQCCAGAGAAAVALLIGGSPFRNERAGPDSGAIAGLGV